VEFNPEGCCEIFGMYPAAAFIVGKWAQKAMLDQKSTIAVGNRPVWALMRIVGPL